MFGTLHAIETSSLNKPGTKTEITEITRLHAFSSLHLQTKTGRVNSNMSAPSVMLAIVGDAAESLSAIRDTNLMTVLLILLLSLALVLCLVCLLVVIHFLRSSRLTSQRELHSEIALPRARSFYPPVFSAPSRWLAIRSGDPQAVQSALGLLKPRPCSWEEGLSAVHAQKLFISPPVDGWILVMGSGLPDPAQDVDKCFHFILALSRKLDAVQFFSANRIVHHHAWVRAGQGRIQRAYAWAGKTLWNQGRMTQAEADLRLKCFGYVEAAEHSYFSQMDTATCNTERVPALAARWSVDPASLRARMPGESQGIAGELSRSRNT